MAVRLIAASQIILICTAVARSSLPGPLRWSYLALSVGVICYLLAPTMTEQIIGLPMGLIMDQISNLVPAMLFLVAWLLFTDDRPVPIWAWLIAVGYTLSFQVWFFSGQEALGFALINQIGKLTLALSTLWFVWVDRRTDLVNDRIRIRVYFCGYVGAAVALVVSVELISLWQVPAVLELLGMTLILLAAFALNIYLVRIPSMQWHPKSLQKPQDPSVQNLINQIENTMVEQRYYAQGDARVTGMADLIGIPDYRLRRIINGNMGYNNFNQFLNSYRLEEAAQRLISEPHTPVLTLALDVGFRSISSFNTSFRTKYRCSPTEYRTDHLTES